MSRSAGQIALITAGTLATGALGYAVYFDYMRRNSADFRRSLRKQAEKVQAEEKRKADVAKARQKLQLRAVLREIQAEEPPVSPEAQEAYFQEQVAMGERLATQGPDVYVEAASHFYRALRVYPQPVELLMIYQKVVPAPIFALVIELTQVPGISPTAGNPLAALGGLGAPAGAGAPRAAASVSDVDADISPAPAGGRVPTDEEIAAIIAAASGRAAPAAAGAQAVEEEEEEVEGEGADEEEEVQEAADELADVMADLVSEVQKGVEAQAAAEQKEAGEGSVGGEGAQGGASWEKVEEA